MSDIDSAAETISIESLNADLQRLNAERASIDGIIKIKYDLLSGLLKLRDAKNGIVPQRKHPMGPTIVEMMTSICRDSPREWSHPEMVEAIESIYGIRVDVDSLRSTRSHAKATFPATRKNHFKFVGSVQE